MSFPNITITELAGLNDAVTAAVAGAISRSVTVLSYEPDDFYSGPWPVIQIAPKRFNWELLTGGQLSLVGNNDNRNKYTLTFMDAIDPSASPGSLVANSQQDLYKLNQAVLNYFNVAPHRCLPDGMGAPRAVYAGPPFNAVFSGTLRGVNGGQVRNMLITLISVTSIPQQQTAS